MLIKVCKSLVQLMLHLLESGDRTLRVLVVGGFDSEQCTVAEKAQDSWVYTSRVKPHPCP